MLNLNKVITIEDVIKNTEELLKDGICTICRAINAAEDSSLPYQCSKSDIEDLMSACREVMRVVIKSKITITQSKAAKSDPIYQTFRRKLFSYKGEI